MEPLPWVTAAVMGLAEGDIQSFTAQATEDGSYIDITVIAAKTVTNAKITKGGKTVGTPGDIEAGFLKLRATAYYDMG